MRALAPCALPDVSHHAPRLQWRSSVPRSAHLCLSRHTPATPAPRQEVVAADAVVSDLLLDPAPPQLARQPALDDCTQHSGPAGPLAAGCSAGVVSWPACAVAGVGHVTAEDLLLLQQQQQQRPSWRIVSHQPAHPQQLQPEPQLTATCEEQPAAPVTAHTPSPPQEGVPAQLQPADLQQQEEDVAAAVEYQKRICRSLSADSSSTVEELAAILAEHTPHMDGQALTASFSAAARLARRTGQQQQQQQGHAGASAGSQQQTSYQLVQLLEQQLLPALQPKLRSLDAVGLQLVLYSLAALRYKQEAVVLQLEVAVTPIVHHLPPGRLCQLVWSLGQLGLKPNSQLVRTVMRCSSRCLSVLAAQDLCQLLQGLVQLQLQLHPLWLDAACARVLQLCAHKQLGPRSLGSILHSLACLVPQQQQQQQQDDMPHAAAGLPQPLLQRLLAATQEAMQDAAGLDRVQQQQQEGQGGMRSLQQQHQHQHGGVLSIQAGVQAVQWPLQQQGVQAALTPAADVFASGILQGSLQQQGHQQLQDKPALQQEQQQQQHRQQQEKRDAGHSLSAAGLATLADALRRLKIDPPEDWQAAYVAAAEVLMHGSDARNLPLLLLPCVRWRRLPGRAWLQQYLAACEGLLPAMHPQGLAVLGHSLTALRVQPSAAWLTAYLAVADSKHLAATPAGCSYLMHALGAWRQLGCLPQQQAGSAEGPAAGSNRAPGSAVGSEEAGGYPPVQGGAVAAAAGQQLQSMAHVLAGQCLRCFMEQGHRFTAEQLGMFCKGLAQWGARGTPELADRLGQVVQQQLSQQVGSRRRRTGPHRHVTAATLCSILLALAVACPEAATPGLLSVLWTSWSAWLLPMTTPAQAAGVAWALGRLGARPPQDFAQGLVQQLVMSSAGDAQAQHVAAVLLQAKLGGWEVRQQHVVTLVDGLLQQLSAQLSVVRLQWAQQQQQQLGCDCRLTAAAHFGMGCRCGSDSLAAGSDRLVDDDTSSSSSHAAARLYGLANHRLKGPWVQAAAATAAWCDILPPQQLQRVVQVYSRGLALLPAEQQGAVQAHLRVLRTAGCSSAASAHPAASCGGGGGGRVQAV